MGGPPDLVAAVVPKDRRIYKVRDSKMLTEAEREAMFDRVADWCERWAVGEASHTECDELGMSAAQRLAAQRAIDGLGVAVDHVLLDGKWDFVGGGATTMIVKGDASCLSIAAASILAKVTTRPVHAPQGRGVRGLRVRGEQGVPVPAAPGGAGRAGAVRAAPAVVGVHGFDRPARCRALRPPRLPGRPVRLIPPRARIVIVLGAGWMASRFWRRNLLPGQRFSAPFGWRHGSGAETCCLGDGFRRRLGDGGAIASKPCPIG
jgi:hypothetical protein